MFKIIRHRKNWNGNINIFLYDIIIIYWTCLLRILGIKILILYKNGNLRKKFSKIRFNKFRWDYFTKIVIVILFFYYL